MYRLVQIALYTIAMFGLGWLLWQVVPPVADWLFDRFGNSVFWISFALWGALVIWLYRLHKRHPEWSISYRRQDSGRFLEPRDP